MSRLCIVTGKKVMTGNNVSHANNRTRRRFLPNLQNVTLHSEALNRDYKMRISTRGIRTIEYHGGLDNYLKTTKNSKLHPDLKKIKTKIQKQKD